MDNDTKNLIRAWDAGVAKTRKVPSCFDDMVATVEIIKRKEETDPWRKIARQVNEIIERRGMTFRQFAAEIGFADTLIHRWIRQEPPTEPRRASANAIVAWCEKHQ